MFALLIVTGSKVFYDFVNDILSSLHFDSFNWKPSARDFVTNLSTRDCIEVVSFFSTHSARVVSYAYFQMFVFATLRSLIIIRNNQGPSLVHKALCRLCNKFFKDDVIQGGLVECTLRVRIGITWSRPVLMICSKSEVLSSQLSAELSIVSKSTHSR